MPYCPNCGSSITSDTCFCGNCGVAIQQSNNVGESFSNDTLQSRRQGGVKPKKKRGKAMLWIILALLTATIGATTLLCFPGRVSLHAGKNDLRTVNGRIDGLEIKIKSNQPIISAQYALNPDDQQADPIYQTVKIGSGIFSKTMRIDKLEVPVGKNELVVKVKTFFGVRQCKLNVTCDIGWSSAPLEEAIIPVSEDKDLVANELIVVFVDSAKDSQIKALIAQYDGEIVGENPLLGEYQVRFLSFGEDYINIIRDQLMNETLVEDVFFNISYHNDVSFIPNDSEYDDWNVSSPGGNNWGLEAIDAPGAWDHNASLGVVRIGVMDSTLQYTHPDLRVNSNRVHFLATEDFKTMNDVMSYFGRYNSTHVCKDPELSCVYCGMRDHGTHCSGIIAALGNNGSGVAGINWRTELYFSTLWYLTSPEAGQLSCRDTTERLLHNLTWMVVNGCRVLSFSFGSSAASAPDKYEAITTRQFERAIKRLEDAGFDFIICKAAGNSNDDARNYATNRIMTGGEHAREHVIMVAAATNLYVHASGAEAEAAGVDRIYSLAGYSNYGDMVDIAAPGSNIRSTVYGNTYENFDGTSMATPMVAGIAGMLYGANPNYTYAQVKEIILRTGKDYCVKALPIFRVYSLVNAKKAVEQALENDQQLPELPNPEFGFVTGIVQDAVTNELIYNAAVQIVNEATGKSYRASVSEGVYEICLPPGTYTMEVSADGYLTETIYHIPVDAEVVQYNVMLNMVPSSPVEGTISGRIIDAFDASSIPNAEIRIFRGINQKDGTPAMTLRSDQNGEYKVSLSPGNYTLAVSADGYSQGSASVLSIGGQYVSDQDCTLTPVLNAGELRIVLTWGMYPEDLDSHLVGPAPNGKFHIFYEDKNCYYQGTLYDNLDVDDTTSYGPETTSVYIGLNGIYTFYVHDYTNRDMSNSSALATSGAQVTLYIAGRDQPIVYNVPNQAGTLWTVFSMQNGVLTPINTMSYESTPYEIGE